MKLYKVTYEVEGYVYAESEQQAISYAKDIVDDDHIPSGSYAEVVRPNDSIADLWDQDSITYGPQFRPLKEVWPKE